MVGSDVKPWELGVGETGCALEDAPVHAMLNEEEEEDEEFLEDEFGEDEDFADEDEDFLEDDEEEVEEEEGFDEDEDEL